MSWSSGIRWDGVEAGYALEAICGRPECSAVIDKGLAYTCGGAHYLIDRDDPEFSGCGGFYCDEHLYLCDFTKGFVCDDCCASGEAVFIERHTPEEIAFLEAWEQAILDEMLRDGFDV